MFVSRRFVEAVRASGRTQAQLGELVGISQSTISGWLRGRDINVGWDRDRVLRLADIVGVSAEFALAAEFDSTLLQTAPPRGPKPQQRPPDPEPTAAAPVQPEQADVDADADLDPDSEILTLRVPTRLVELLEFYADLRGLPTREDAVVRAIGGFVESSRRRLNAPPETKAS